MTSTVAVFADVQNLYYTARQAHQRNVDYNALWARCRNGLSFTLKPMARRMF